jgi:hypothetical protein
MASEVRSIRRAQCPGLLLGSSDDAKAKAGVSFFASTPAQQQLALEVKRLYLRRSLPGLTLATDPTVLWNAILQHRYIPAKGTSSETTEEAGAQYDDLRLTYEGFRNAAHQCLFGESNDKRARDKVLTEEEKRDIFFTHPFLSPQTFLLFGRDECGAVPAVQLYAFVAKKLLLFRLRVTLELVASVSPVACGVSATSGTVAAEEEEEESEIEKMGQAKLQRPAALLRCRPSQTSPLSSSLACEDVEAFLCEILPNLRTVRDMPLWMKPYYLCHATRKFFFMCDPRQTGSICIDDFMASEVFSELLRIYESDLHDAVVVYPIGSYVQVPLLVAYDVWRLRAAGGDASCAATATDLENGALPGDEDYIEAIVTGVDGEGNGLTDVYTVQVDFRSATFPVEVTRDKIFWSPLSHDATESGGSEGLRENWFSLSVMNRVYEHFTELDADCDGVLTLDEFRRYGSGSFTGLAMQRVFEVHVPKGATISVAAEDYPNVADERKMGTDDSEATVKENEDDEQRIESGDNAAAPSKEAAGVVAIPVMDFKTYLHFVLATELPHTVPGAKYLWRLVNLDDEQYVPLSQVRQFSREVAEQLVVNGLMTDISVDSIMSEIVDMINPRRHDSITFEDLVKSNQCGTVLPILINFRNFYAYDCREQNIVQAADTEEFVTKTP